MRRGFAALAAAGLVAALGVRAGAAEPDGTPASVGDAAERGVVQKVCGRCHSPEIVLDTAKGRDEWRDTIQTMVDRGAHATDDEFDQIVDYLDAHVTTININAADADALQEILRVSPQVADAIVARSKSRPFKDLADLETVAGVEAGALEAKRKLIFF